MIKGYNIIQTVLHERKDGDEYILLVNVGAGCPACQENGQVLPGHSLCEITPSELEGEPVYARLEQGWGWVLEWCGDYDAVDEWLIDYD